MTENVPVTLVILAGLVLLFWMSTWYRRNRRRGSSAIVWINSSALKEMLKGAERPLMIDVRTPAEFDGPLGHIPDAINLPLNDFQVRLNAKGVWWQGSVVLVCHTDKRSASAAGLLASEGVKGVHVLRGGMEAWNRTRAP